MVDNMEQLTFFSSENKSPLSNLSRPDSIDEFFGQENEVKIIKKMIEKKQLVNMIIFGPTGSGKTTISKIIAKSFDYNFEYLNAIKSGVQDIKEISRRAKSIFNMSGKKTILLFDEIHSFNKSQQDSLLEDLEDGNIILIGSTTENPYYRLNKAIISRCVVLEFKKLSDEALVNIIDNVCLKNNIKIDENIKKYILEVCDGDARSAINILDLIEKTDLETVKNGIKIGSRYGKSDKYDMISAMIKSIRGSDENAGVYWLSAMLTSNEDPMYIARRLVISAAEDIGLANPNAIVVANACMQAVDKIGMPEARIILSECLIYLCLSPKSNSAYNAVNSAFSDIEQNGIQEVPFHLTKRGASKYLYPHDYKNHYIKQKYMEKEMKLYNFGLNKTEQKMKEYIEKIKGVSDNE